MAVFALGIALAAGAFVASDGRRSSAASDEARGMYLATSAGACADCHGEGLRGAKLDFLRPGMPVRYTAPKIAGLPGLSVVQATTFFVTGKLPDGRHARPPMPQYRFHRDDAQALASYLKSLQ